MKKQKTETDILEGWTKGELFASVVVNGKQHKNMQAWSRPCAVCDTVFTDYTRHNKPWSGTELGRRNCQDHAGLKAAIDRGYLEWRDGAIRPGPKCEAVEDADPADSARLAAVHFALIGAGYKITPDQIPDAVRALLPQPKASFPWNS